MIQMLLNLYGNKENLNKKYLIDIVMSLYLNHF